MWTYISSEYGLGFKVQRLKVLPFGFAVMFKIDMDNYNKKVLKANLLSIKKIIVASLGPLVNLVLIVIFVLIGKEKIFNVEAEILIYINLLIFVLNILPIYPLDGGRIIKNIIYLFFGKVISLRTTIIISNITAVFLTVITVIISIMSKNISYIFVLTYIWIIVMKENKICKMKIKMYKILKNNIAINRD